nr:hypothetical protein HK105_003913 [Polyrhizophydium stewartii]
MRHCTQLAQTTSHTAPRFLLSSVMLEAREHVVVPIVCLVQTAPDTHSFMALCPTPASGPAILHLEDRGMIDPKNAAALNAVSPLVVASSLNPSQIKAACHAQYEILSRPSIDLFDGQRFSTISLAVFWDAYVPNPLSLPSIPRHAKLTIHCEPGSCDTENHIGIADIRKQLETLAEWNVLRESHPEWTVCGVAAPGDDDMDTSPPDDAQAQPKPLLSAAVDAFLESRQKRLHISTAVPTTKASASSTHMLVDGFGAIRQRTEFDFAEQMWLFFHRAERRDDMVDALTAVIEELETGRLLPRVAKDNLCSLANVIRSCLKLAAQQHSTDAREQRESISATFDFWLEQPLECLVDAGIWKLKRDYQVFFLEGNVASRHQLEPFIDPTLALGDQIQRLWCLHRVLEVYNLVKTNILALPDQVTRAIVQATLRYYKSMLDAPAEASGDDSEMEGNSGASSRSWDQPLVLEVAMPKFSAESQKAVAALCSSFDASMWMAAVPLGVDGASKAIVVLDQASALVHVGGELGDEIRRSVEAAAAQSWVPGDRAVPVRAVVGKVHIGVRLACEAGPE